MRWIVYERPVVWSISVDLSDEHRGPHGPQLAGTSASAL
jgi:hypothetical protein